MVMDYVLNPMICTILCSKLAMNYFPGTPYAFWVVFFAILFTALNLQGIKSSARTNEVLGIVLSVVVVIFLGAAVRYLMGVRLTAADLTRPFYDPATFSLQSVLTGASIACLTYIGFDGISTLSEEAENPRRNILLATVLTCLADRHPRHPAGLRRAARLGQLDGVPERGHGVRARGGEGGRPVRCSSSSTSRCSWPRSARARARSSARRASSTAWAAAPPCPAFFAYVDPGTSSRATTSSSWAPSRSWAAWP